MWVRVEFSDPTRTRPISRGDFVSRSESPSEAKLPRRRVVVLGSTGSIGTNCLDVIASLSERLELLGLSGHANRELLLEQAIQHRPRWVTVTDPDGVQDFAAIGLEGLEGEAVAIVGAAGLAGTWAALEAGKTVAVANKETLVMAGPLVMELAARRGVRLLPVDSEHSGIFQAIQSGTPDQVERVVLTASGGPFRGRSRADLLGVSVADALRHPTWKMGPKITVDSATLMNKALEIIEARWLFGLPPERIEVIIHPESMIHSFVEFKDGSVLAQLSPPDMRLPIQYALTYPERVPAIWCSTRRRTSTSAAVRCTTCSPPRCTRRAIPWASVS